MFNKLKELLVKWGIVLTDEQVTEVDALEEGESEPSLDEPAKEDAEVEEPAKDEPAKDEPAKDEPAIEEPAKEEPVVEEHKADEPTPPTPYQDGWVDDKGNIDLDKVNDEALKGVLKSLIDKVKSVDTEDKGFNPASPNTNTGYQVGMSFSDALDKQK
jgi:hypothetical protein